MSQNSSIELAKLSFGANDIILEAGAACKGAFLIESGLVEVYRDVDQRRVVITQLGKGEIFGELAVIDDVPHAHHVRAIQDTQCLLITPAQYQELFANTPGIMKLFLSRVVRKLRMTTDTTFGKS